MVDQVYHRVNEKSPTIAPAGETFEQIETKAAKSKITRMTVLGRNPEGPFLE